MMRLLEENNYWDNKLYQHALDLFSKAVARTVVDGAYKAY